MANMYYNHHVKEEVLEGKKIAIIGYGSQWHAHAQNLKDSGHDVSVGVRRGKSFKQAQEDGITGMRYSISDTAQWGDFVSGPRVVDAATKERMKDILDAIQTGKFAKGWLLENQLNRPEFTAIERNEEQHQIEQVGRELRAITPFVNEGKKKQQKEVVSSAQN